MSCSKFSLKINTGRVSLSNNQDPTQIVTAVTRCSGGDGGVDGGDDDDDDGDDVQLDDDGDGVDFPLGNFPADSCQGELFSLWCSPAREAAVTLREGYDLSSLLTFDPESIEPASKASEESGPSATHGQLQHLKALLSSSIETLVEDIEGIKSILEDIQPHLPVTLQVKLWPVVTLSAYKSRVTLARSFGRKNDTSVGTAVEILRKELEDLEERVRVTKQLIQDKEALIARSHEEAEGLKAELKTDLAEIRALNKQLVTGQDEDDEAEIAEVDRVALPHSVPLRHSFSRAPPCNDNCSTEHVLLL
ncbi:hypothetical protein QYE76_000947 [Lolium multiflorum]|uniref:Uncharacterized protein n=1 Tax=Lolium multiflorum TaxID=4521 RepID=A0AAD8RL36_LOLMU|nr:hypothetical protein QYE76_000947 [Lolium multiflorum]